MPSFASFKAQAKDDMVGTRTQHTSSTDPSHLRLSNSVMHSDARLSVSIPESASELFPFRHAPHPVPLRESTGLYFSPFATQTYPDRDENNRKPDKVDDEAPSRRLPHDSAMTMHGAPSSTPEQLSSVFQSSPVLPATRLAEGFKTNLHANCHGTALDRPDSHNEHVGETALQTFTQRYGIPTTPGSPLVAIDAAPGIGVPRTLHGARPFACGRPESMEVVPITAGVQPFSSDSMPVTHGTARMMNVTSPVGEHTVSLEPLSHLMNAQLQQNLTFERPGIAEDVLQRRTGSNCKPQQSGTMEHWNENRSKLSVSSLPRDTRMNDAVLLAGNPAAPSSFSHGLLSNNNGTIERRPAPPYPRIHRIPNSLATASPYSCGSIQNNPLRTEQNTIKKEEDGRHINHFAVRSQSPTAPVKGAKARVFKHPSMNVSKLANCHHCNKTFKTGKDRQRHMRRMHVLKGRYPCPFAPCSQSFAEAHKLSRHIETVHLMKRPFKCTECDSCFGERGNMMQHIRKAHPVVGEGRDVKRVRRT